MYSIVYSVLQYTVYCPQCTLKSLHSAHMCLEYSVVKLSGWSFQDPSLYFNKPEEENLKAYNSFFTGVHVDNHNVKVKVQLIRQYRGQSSIN